MCFRVIGGHSMSRGVHPGQVACPVILIYVILDVNKCFSSQNETFTWCSKCRRQFNFTLCSSNNPSDLLGWKAVSTGFNSFHIQLSMEFSLACCLVSFTISTGYFYFSMWHQKPSSLFFWIYFSIEDEVLLVSQIHPFICQLVVNDSRSPEAKKKSALAASAFHIRTQVGQQHDRLASTWNSPVSRDPCRPDLTGLKADNKDLHTDTLFHTSHGGFPPLSFPQPKKSVPSAHS